MIDQMRTRMRVSCVPLILTFHSCSALFSCAFSYLLTQARVQSLAVPSTPAKFAPPSIADFTDVTNPLCLFVNGHSNNSPWTGVEARDLEAFLRREIVFAKPAAGTADAPQDGFSIADIFAMCGRSVTMCLPIMVRLLHHRVCNGAVLGPTKVRQFLRT